MQDHPDAVKSCPCCAKLNWQAAAVEEDQGQTEIDVFKTYAANNGFGFALCLFCVLDYY